MLLHLLTLLVALKLALAPMAQATIQTAAYGGSFGDAFKGSFINSVVALGLADAQTGIGGVFANGANGGEGSLGHVLLHGLAGCVAAQAQGADCAAGAAGGIAQAVYAGTLQPNMSAADREGALNRAQLIGALAGYLFSGGKAENVAVGAAVAQSGLANNYLKHDEWGQYLSELEACGSDEACRSTTAERYIDISLSNREALLSCGSDRACLDQKRQDILKVYDDPALRSRIEAQVQDLAVYALMRVDVVDGEFLLTALNSQSVDYFVNGLENPALRYAGEYAAYKAASCASLSGPACLSAFNAQYASQTAAGLPAEMASNAFDIFALTGIGGAIAGTYGCATGLSLASCAEAAIEVLPGGLDAGAKVLIKRGDTYTEATIGVYADGTRYLEVAPNRTVPDGWRPVTGVGAQVSTPRGFTTYRTPDGDLVHVSPGGLQYGADPKFGNRVDHVLDHTAPNPKKPVHSVFNAQGDDALDLVDQAWARRGAPDPNDAAAFVVDMNRPLFAGG